MIDEISQRYIELAFAIEARIAGYVDAYFGPEELRRSAPDLAHEALVDAVATLREQIRAGDYPAQRKHYLDVQLRAMQMTARRLAGDSPTFFDEVRACFDIEPVFTPEIVFEQANAELEAALPGNEPLAERIAAWKQRFVVDAETARRMIDVIAAEARRRSASLVELPDTDEVRFELVEDKPWSGYNWYLGGGRSLVEINTDLPIRANTLLDLICHEAYPGHHTEHALKEQRLYRERGWGEQAIQLINVPECVISEGIATLAAEIIFGDHAYEWAAAHVYPLGKIDGDPERERRIAAAQRNLRALSANTAILLHEHGIGEAEAGAYLMRYGLRSEHEARQSIRFLTTPLWRVYAFTYFAGRDLLSRWIAAGDDPQQRFRTLLTEQIYPSLLHV
jgi:hypothetical protein